MLFQVYNRMIQLYIYMYVSMTFSLPIISFRNHAFSVVSKKSLPNVMLSRSFMLSSKSFMILYFTRNSELERYDIRVSHLMRDSSFFFLHVDIQLIHRHLLERLDFLHCIASAPLTTSLDQIVWLWFWTLCSVPLICLFFQGTVLPWLVLL